MDRQCLPLSRRSAPIRVEGWPVEVIRIKPGNTLQVGPVVNVDMTIADGPQTGIAKFLHRPADVNG